MSDVNDQPSGGDAASPVSPAERRRDLQRHPETARVDPEQDAGPVDPYDRPLDDDASG